MKLYDLALSPYAARVRIAIYAKGLDVRVHPLLGDTDPTSTRPPLAAWWKGVAQHPAVAKVEAELAKALAVMLGGER